MSLVVFVQKNKALAFGSSNIIKNFTNRFVLEKGIFIGTVQNNKKKVCINSFFKGGFECINKRVGQIGNESYCVGNKNCGTILLFI